MTLEEAVVVAGLDFVQSQIDSVQVAEKAVPLEVDLARLACFDGNPVDSALCLSKDEEIRENYLMQLARDNTQWLVNSLFNLPKDAEPVDVGVMALLPEPTELVPREKPVPKAAAPTRWEAFAKTKGIQHRKKSRMAYDEESGEYKPISGYKSKQNEMPWLIEVPENADPMEDQYAKRREEKKTRVKHNEALQRRNSAVRQLGGSGESLSSHSLGSTQERSKKHALAVNSLQQATVSQASLGRFAKPLETKVKPRKK